MIINAIPSLAQEEESDKGFWGALAERYFTRHEKLTNRTSLSALYGPCSVNLLNYDTFSPAFSTEVRYGFVRFDNELGIDSLYGMASEFAFLGDASSRFKLDQKKPTGLTIDSWYFGFTKKSGIGVKFKNTEITPYHSASLVWNRCDFENISPDSTIGNLQRVFDENFKFGTAWSAGVESHLYGSIYLNLEYRKDLYFQSFSAGKYLGVLLFDNMFQALPEFFEPVLLKQYGAYYPYVKFIYKNGISYFLYQARKNAAFFPFKSDRSFSMDRFNVGINFIF